MAILTAFSVLYGLSPYLNEDLVPIIDPTVSVTYGSLHRFAWATAVGWVIFACKNGYGGGDINKSKINYILL